MTPERDIPVLETDRRYLRNRVLNRRVRKARLIRSGLRLAGLVIGHTAFVGLLLGGLYSAALHLMTSERLAVSTFEVEGARRADPEGLRRALAARWGGRNILEIDLEDVAATTRVDPWVRDAEVKRVLTDTLRVVVSEREPAALALVRGVVVVIDAAGAVIGPVGPGLAYDLPILVVADGDASPDTLARGVDAVRRLEESIPGFSREISELDLSRSDRVSLATVSPGPRLMLDPERVERNVEVWIGLRDDILRRIGATEYVDLRWDSRIVLKPTEDSTPNLRE